jgi:type IV pilus assembly protein PilM
MADDVEFSIDLNEKQVRMGEARLVKNGIELISLGYSDNVPLYFTSDAPNVIEQEAEVLAKLHSNLRIRKKDVHVVIPDAFTFSRVVEMPRLKEKELIAAIKYQADEFIPMAIEETNLDLEVLRDDEKNNKMLIFIVASPKKVIEKIQKTVELADFVPNTLENEMSAVARLTSVFFKQTAQQKGTTILVNFGYSTTSLYLFDPQSLLLITRTFKIGLNIFIKDLVANYNWDELKATQALKTLGVAQDGSVNLDPVVTPIIDEVAKEIERFALISRDKYGTPVSSVFAFNYDNAINSLHKKLQDKLSIPVQSLKLEGALVPNPIQQSFSAAISSFISVIAGNIS